MDEFFDNLITLNRWPKLWQKSINWVCNHENIFKQSTQTKDVHWKNIVRTHTLFHTELLPLRGMDIYSYGLSNSVKSVYASLPSDTFSWEAPLSNLFMPHFWYQFMGGNCQNCLCLPPFWYQFMGGNSVKTTYASLWIPIHVWQLSQNCLCLPSDTHSWEATPSKLIMPPFWYSFMRGNSLKTIFASILISIQVWQLCQNCLYLPSEKRSSLNGSKFFLFWEDSFSDRDFICRQ